MSWLTDNTEGQEIQDAWAADLNRPKKPEKTGLLKAAGMGAMRGSTSLARGVALAASVFAPHEDAPDDGSRILPRKEDFFKFIDRLDTQTEPYWTPDPESVGLAGQIAGSLAGLPMQIGAGGGLMAITAGLNTGTHLTSQGVDPATAAVAAVGSGTANALMMKLPQVGRNWMETVGLSTLMPTVGAAQDLALKTGLESQGYHEQAAAINPLDPVSRLTDLTLGGIFGAMGHRSARMETSARTAALDQAAGQAETYAHLIEQAGGEQAVREKLPVQVVDSLDTINSHLKTLETNPFNKTASAGVDQHLDMLRTSLEQLNRSEPVQVADQAEPVLKQPPPSMDYQNFMDKVSARFGMTPEEETAYSALISARARAQGMTPDAWVSQHIADVTTTQPPEGALLQDRQPVQPFYSKLLKEVDALPQEKWNPGDLLNKIRKTEGVKGDEIAWTGLEDFLRGKKSVTRAEVREYLDQNQVQIQEVTKGEGESQYGKYVEPGGENYRELLLTLPDGHQDYVKRLQDKYGDSWVKDSTPEETAQREKLFLETGKNYRSSHFDEPNVLAHVRFNERTGPNDERILHLEEIQSDWHQARRDGKDVPDAPFSKTWHELALKRMVRYAAENGFDRLTWTTGEQQAERYDISKKMESVSYRREGERFILNGVDKHGDEHSLGEFSRKQLPDAVGKELAQKITNGEGKPEGRWQKLSGLDLKVGGAGMKGFYDKMLPSYLKSLGKKFGTTVADVTLPDTGTVHSLPITDAMRESVVYSGQPLFQGEKGAVSFLTDGRAVIHALEQPDFSTAVHELAHVFSQTLSDAEAHQFERWLMNYSRGKTGEWSAADHELFARAFEKYLSEGKAPTPELQGAFDKFKNWLVDLYRSIVGSPLEMRLNANAKAAFDRLLFNESFKPEVAPEVAELNRELAAQRPEHEADLNALAGEPPPHLNKPAQTPPPDKPTPARIVRDIINRAYEDPELIKRFVAEPTNVAGALAHALELEAGRVEKAGKAQRGPSLVEYLRTLGINDDRGDLAAMDIDKGLKPGQKRLLNDRGVSLDRARELAAEKGYLPTDSSTADLLDAIGQETRGQSVYPVTGDDAAELPGWFQSLTTENRRTNKFGKELQQTVKALRQTAEGQFDKLPPKQQDIVLAALDHINHEAQASAQEIDAFELKPGDRFMTRDFAWHTVTADRDGHILLADGGRIPSDSLLHILGEVDQSGRPPEAGYDPLDYQVESLLQERGDFPIAMGTDAAGNQVMTSARDVIDGVKDDLANTENQKHLYDRAAACMGLEFNA